MEITFKQTPNYTKGAGINKIGWVLHGTLGSYKGAVEWLLNGNRTPKSSAHFVIGRKEGEVTQLVKISDIAWHAGGISNPSERAKKVLPKGKTGYLNPNTYFVGIEFAWGYDTDGDGDVDTNDGTLTLTDWQLRCATYIMENSGIPFNPDMVLSHQEITDYKGDKMDFAVQQINAIFKKKQEDQHQIPAVDKDKVLAEINTHLEAIKTLSKML